MKRIAESINTLGAFCGKRDVDALTQERLFETYGFRQADVMVLFGGSILAGGDVLAEAMKNGVSKKYIIVGGEGHTTQTLREKCREAYPDIDTQGMAEAQVFQAYLKRRFYLQADALEIHSTNCGNNITNLLALMKENGIDFRSIILSQDASMQRRMEAGLQKYVGSEVQIINYAVYAAKVVDRNLSLEYEEEIWGMWDMERYISLLLGEIPRLTDDAEGYGPNGKGFIAHVDIPADVQDAFQVLKSAYGGWIRKANPLYASKG